MKSSFLVACFLSFQFAWASPFSPSAHSKPQAVKLHSTFLQSKPDKENRDTLIVPDISHPSLLTSKSFVIKRRLDSLKKDVPLDYNEYVQSYVDIFIHNRDEMGHVLGLSKYYFPIYEKAFHDAGIPDEIKYLSVIESKLDPYAVSKVGATGPWQFMFTTGKLYGLNINEYVDDRRDPIQASYAAAAYLKDAYQEFGDWLLAIASYNCGASNVERAIKKAGKNDFWSIRQYLPTETRGYVPAFIAVAYVMNFYDKHNIILQPCSFSIKTDTVLVNKSVALKTISQVLNVDIKELAILNPSYKRQIVNGTNAAPRRLVIPQIDKEKYSALYEALNNSNTEANASQPVAVSYNENKFEKTPSFHVVKRGETLTDIADNFGIELQDLKVWNHLHSHKAVVGQKLKISEPSNEEDSKLKQRHNYITYKVKNGDTLSGIAAKFDGASIEKIRSINGLKRDKLQPGMRIKI
jgi:membrane-bound lytic murein transglycosylase D